MARGPHLPAWRTRPVEGGRRGPCEAIVIGIEGIGELTNTVTTVPA